MSEFIDNVDFDVLDNLLDQVECVTFAVAQKRIEESYPDDDPKETFYDFLNTEMIRTYADCAMVHYSSMEKVTNWKNFNDFSKYLSSKYKKSCRIDGPLFIKKRFWDKKHLTNNNVWEGIIDSFSNAIRANWNNNIFSLAEMQDFVFEIPYPIGYYHLYGVKVNKNDLDIVAPANVIKEQANFNNQPVERLSKFDWEAAFADVAAWLFYDADIPNVNTRGVQSQIEIALGDSFAKRNLPTPSEGTLRKKARIICASLRAFKS